MTNHPTAQSKSTAHEALTAALGYEPKNVHSVLCGIAEGAEIDVRMVDESFDHEFGTESGYSIETESAGTATHKWVQEDIEDLDEFAQAQQTMTMGYDCGCEEAADAGMRVKCYCKNGVQVRVTLELQSLTVNRKRVSYSHTRMDGSTKREAWSGWILEATIGWNAEVLSW